MGLLGHLIYIYINILKYRSDLYISGNFTPVGIAMVHDHFLQYGMARLTAALQSEDGSNQKP